MPIYHANKMNIKYLAHTADVRMVITAQTLYELFEFSLKGMSNILKTDACLNANSENHKSVIEIQASDMTNLLIDFLSEVLSISYVNNVIYCEIKFSELSASKITAEVSGQKIDRFDEEIKAVTYHEANITENVQGNWTVTIILDI